MTLDLQSPISATLPNSGATTPAPVAGEETSTNVLSSDFETFLLMLTTQLENQDPLNPIESQDFAVQLATFSGVEQQVQTNELLRNLAGALGASDLAQLAGWVGMEAQVTAPIAFDGEPVDIAVVPDPGSDRAELIIRDSLGREVGREGVAVTSGVYAWVGTDATGDPLAPGLYSLELASINQGEVTSVQAVAHYARITEARQGPGGIELVVSGGSVVASDTVSALREPAAASGE